MMSKEDLTHNQYGSVIRRRMQRNGYTQHSLEEELELPERSISALINGRQFMSAANVRKLLEHLEFSGLALESLIVSIDYQRLHPIVANPFINARIKAVRTLTGRRGADFATDELSAATIGQVESFLTEVGPYRLELFEKAFGRRLRFVESEIDQAQKMLEEYSEEEILTVAFYLINQYQSRNVPKGNKNEPATN